MFEKSKYKKFELVNDGIFYKNEYHSFDSVKHLHFERVITTERMNFVKVGEPESAILKIELSSGEIVKLKFDESTIFIGVNFNKQDEIQNLINLYLDLCKKTFLYRLESYEKQVEKEGFFIYEKCHFFPQTKIVIKNKEYLTRDNDFLKCPGYILIKKKNQTVIDKAKYKWNPPFFETKTDTDVIFFLLGEHFGLKWK